MENFVCVLHAEFYSKAIFSALVLVAYRTLNRSERIDGKDAASWPLNASEVAIKLRIFLKCDGHGNCL